LALSTTSKKGYFLFMAFSVTLWQQKTALV